MIVIHHSVDLFGIRSIGINFGQGVSFFFVLSGFILTFVYPKLDTWLEIKRFWRARIARIWPAYFASFVLGFCLISYAWDSKTAAAHLFMVQGWIPVSTYYFSYNAVAWSVSTEFFFYLAFPVILYNWNKSWLIKLILSSAVLIALITLSNLIALPDYGDPAIGLNGSIVTQHGLLYINPISRIFEFIFGMCIALAWRRKAEIQWNPVIATSYELGAITLCATSMYYMNSVAAWSNGSPLGSSTTLWLTHSGSVFVFGLLIYVLAQGRGTISKILALPFLVLLGEISFSSYLIHQILLGYYKANITGFAHLSNPLAFGLFFSILLLSSYLMWTCIEMPGRRLIIGHSKIHGTTIMKKSWHDHLFLSRKFLFAGLALSCIIGFMYFTMGNANSITQNEAINLTPASLRGYAGTNFGNLFTLRGLDVECEPDGLHVKLAWASKVAQKLSFTTAIHLIDDTRRILGQSDYKQPMQTQGVNPGDIWLDTLFIPAHKLDDKMRGLAIGLYEGSGTLLLIDRGTRDWGGRRLIISTGNCPVN